MWIIIKLLNENGRRIIAPRWTLSKFVNQWFPIFLICFSVILDTLFVALIRAFVTARLAMISRSTSSRTLYLYHVSNLKFLSKVIEKVAATRLTDYLRDNDLNECLQFAYKKHHISETALPRVLNDILKSINNKQCVVLLLLDLSAAFDTVNHKILLHRLQSRFVVKKFKSKLKTFLFKRVYEVSSVFILHFCNYVRIICK